MACPDYGSPTLHPFVQYALARVTAPPPRITQWYSGAITGWVNDPGEAEMYAARQLAESIRRALGAGVVVQVYSLINGELLGQF